ncbi:GNAT family N-acetyltransferase [Chitinophaga sp. OAE865]|uniref:GNAT family N-acetyltransferase n=1 Tax=Chitinophaga sp. OAE865 TaxID=2817898 RepID=UPI001AEA004E
MKRSIVVLDSRHKKALFCCGKPSLDTYLHTQAKQDVGRKVAACFVLEGEDGVIKGYYTLSSDAIKRESLPETTKKKLPTYKDLPVILLGRLAIDGQFARQGFGKLLLLDALKKSYETSNVVGAIAVVVDPLDEEARIFYENYGFIRLPDSKRMFLPMATIKELFR